MQTVLICDGITKDYLSPEPSHLTYRNNIGRGEIERLMGGGKAFGEGPLPSFLRAAVEAREGGESVGIVFLQGPQEDADGEADDSELSDFVEPMAAVASETLVVRRSNDRVPGSVLIGAIDELTGLRPDQITAGEGPVQSSPMSTPMATAWAHPSRSMRSCAIEGRRFG